MQAYPWDAISQLNNPASSKEQVGVRNTSLPPTNAVLAIEFTSFNESSIKNKVWLINNYRGDLCYVMFVDEGSECI